MKAVNIKSLLWIVSLFSVVAFGALAQATSAQVEPPKMKFNWPSSGTVKVVESVLKKNRRARTAYDLQLNTDKDNNLLVTYDNFRFLYIEGVDISHPEIFKQLAPVLALTAAAPGYKVDSAGTLVGVVGLYNMVERLSNMDLVKKNMDEQKRAGVLAMLKNPQLLEVMETKAASNWHAWVSLLVDFPDEDEVGAIYKLKTESVAFGQVIPFDLTYERMAVTDPKHKGLVKMLIESKSDNSAIIEAAGTFVKNMMKQSGQSQQEIDEMVFESADQRTIVEILTDPLTLRPIMVKVETVLDMQIKGEKANRQIEEHKYDFTWPASR